MTSSFVVSSNPIVLFYNALQIVMVLTQYAAEKKDSGKYSKFASNLVESSSKGDDKLVPSRIGMLIIYTPALIVSAAFCLGLPTRFVNPAVAETSLASMMIFIHFLKRDLEVLFLHKYSGNTLLGLARFIGFYYALGSFAVASVAPSELSDSTTSTVAIVLFAVGTLGNLYHHYLLATLRQQKGGTNNNNRRYLPPRGGLFEYVAAPHYLFELIAWLGIGVASCNLTGYLTMMSMTMYLAARASNQNEWNRTKFDEKEWPASRRNILPFIF